MSRLMSGRLLQLYGFPGRLRIGENSVDGGCPRQILSQDHRNFYCENQNKKFYLGGPNMTFFFISHNLCENV